MIIDSEEMKEGKTKENKIKKEQYAILKKKDMKEKKHVFFSFQIIINFSLKVQLIIKEFIIAKFVSFCL